MESRICPFLQRDENLIHQSSVRSSRKCMLLRFAHLGSSHHLHCFGDLRSVADRFDPAPYVLRIRHSKLQIATCGLRDGKQRPHRQVALNSSSAAFNCDSISLSSSFFSRIAASNPAFRVSSQSWSLSWYSLTRSTGT